MKQMFKKLFAGQPAQLAQADHQEESPNMAEQELQASAAADKTVDLSAQLATATEALAAASNHITELTAKHDALVASLSAFEAEKLAAAEAAKATLLASRGSKLEAILGSVKAPAALAKLSALDDATFEAVTSMMSETYEAEKESPMFKEAGVDAKAETLSVDEESAEMKTIKAKQAAFAAQSK